METWNHSRRKEVQRGILVKGWQGALSHRVGNVEQALLRTRGTGRRHGKCGDKKPLLWPALSSHCFLVSELQAAEVVGQA